MFYKMTDRHLKLLAEVGVLKHIIANKGSQVEQVSICYLFIYLFQKMSTLSLEGDTS